MKRKKGKKFLSDPLNGQGFYKKDREDTGQSRASLPLARSGSLDLAEHVGLLTFLLWVIGLVSSGLLLPVLAVDVQADGALVHHGWRNVLDFPPGLVVHGQLHDLPVRAGVVVVLRLGLQNTVWSILTLCGVDS